MKLRSPIPQKKARLEIIPLIDIMFFLLASFMLVSLTMAKQQTIKVSLPTATTAKTDFKPDMINLAVDAGGNYFMDTIRVTLPDLEKALFEKFKAKPETPVYISGDANARHGSMVQVLDTVRRVGFQKVAFQTKAPDMAKGPAAPASPAAGGAPAPAAAAPPASAPSPASAPVQ